MTFVRLLPPAPPMPQGRRLFCVCCGMLVRVFDIPEGYVDERTYVCGQCFEVRA